MCKKRTGEVTMYGRVQKCLSNATFEVKLTNGFKVIAHASGKVRRNYIRIQLNDWVRVNLSAYDLNKGRIVYRYKPEQYGDMFALFKKKQIPLKI